ncbi:MAG: hypothetical protein VBE63_02905 [Lamprobacter sp.]|uniref:hypothetical protein n=1 Tax=Lamprobacter sp. TaxID=3100796 RepID=UPI002B261794|nr:hypothetical protein [Lamprobacter sp.]MEA3638875.1 hypothetical protein [Lamprobacter sp.]
MSETALLQIKRRFSDAYRARDYAACIRQASEGLQLAEASQDVASQTLMLVWLGESHWQRKETEPAVTALRRAAAAEPPADPGDVFNAISTLLSIAILERPLAEAKALIAQGLAHLERYDQQRSRHMLDLSEGDLAARRGDWQAALTHYREAYKHQQGDTGSPRFTLASYQIKLAEASFMLGDAEALSRWCSEINAAPKLVEGDRLRAEQARLLCYRAGIGEPAGARGGPAATARRVLCWLEEIDGHQADYARDAMQVLLREADWLSVETWLDYPGIGDTPLLHGDLYLARARYALGLPVHDPAWATATPSAEVVAHPAASRQASASASRQAGTASAPSNSLVEKTAPKACIKPWMKIGMKTRPNRPKTVNHVAKARDHLEAARAHYLDQQSWAVREDQRLETDHHRRLLDARLEQVDALHD